MSKNPNSIYVFVKGNKGKGAYAISNTNGEVLNSNILDGLTDKEGHELHPSHTDWCAIIKSLEHIRDNRGMGKMPANPVVFIFTTFENNYDVALGIKEIRNPEYNKYLEQVNHLKAQLKRGNQTPKDDNVRFHWVPENFRNSIDYINDLLQKNKKNKNR